MLKLLCSKGVPQVCKDKYGDIFEFICPDNVGEAYTMEEILDKVKDADAFWAVSMATTKEIIDAGKNLKYLATLGVGVDGYPFETANARHIPVVNTPTAVTEATAEFTIAMIVSIYHNMADYTIKMKAGVWENETFGDRQELILGKTLGIVGMGRIGRLVAKKAQALGMKVIYYNRHRLTTWDEKESGFEYCSTLEELLSRSDCVSLHCPLTDSTRHLMNAQTFSLMKDGAYFINASRGGVVDTNALAEALRNGKLKGAAIDVYEEEPCTNTVLAQFDNVVLSPHVASETLESRTNMALEDLAGLAALVRGERPYNLCNPECFAD